MKQDLSEVFAVYLSFATELEEQSKQLREKVGQASCSLNGHGGVEVQSKYLSVWHRDLTQMWHLCRHPWLGFLRETAFEMGLRFAVGHHCDSWLE